MRHKALRAQESPDITNTQKVTNESRKIKGSRKGRTHNWQVKMEYGKGVTVATLNLKGIKRAGKREEVERWKKKQVSIY